MELAGEAFDALSAWRGDLTGRRDTGLAVRAPGAVIGVGCAPAGGLVRGVAVDVGFFCSRLDSFGFGASLGLGGRGSFGGGIGGLRTGLRTRPVVPGLSGEPGPSLGVPSWLFRRIILPRVPTRLTASSKSRSSIPSSSRYTALIASEASFRQRPCSARQSHRYAQYSRAIERRIGEDPGSSVQAR